MGRAHTQIAKQEVQRKVVVVYFIRPKDVQYMISLLLGSVSVQSAPGRGYQIVHKTSQSATYTASNPIYTKVDRGQTTLTPWTDGFHSAFNDWVKKLGSLLSASRSK
jgi:hypothetical protein